VSHAETDCGGGVTCGGQVESIRGVLKIPSVFLEVSTRYVIVQEWVDGVKLTQLQEDKSPQSARVRGEVVRKLLNRCASRVLAHVRASLSSLVLKLASHHPNSYMVQLLETGFLHADPHPGNFLYLPDGRLCILDFGASPPYLPTTLFSHHPPHHSPYRVREWPARTSFRSFSTRACVCAAASSLPPHHSVLSPPRTTLHHSPYQACPSSHTPVGLALLYARVCVCVSPTPHSLLSPHARVLCPLPPCLLTPPLLQA
jgi:serine/threonine protein kinase